MKFKKLVIKLLLAIIASQKSIMEYIAIQEEEYIGDENNFWIGIDDALKRDENILKEYTDETIESILEE